jgi:hypothetical protein
MPVSAPAAATNQKAPNPIKVVTDNGEVVFTFTIVAPFRAIAVASNENALPGSTITTN